MIPPNFAYMDTMFSSDCVGKLDYIFAYKKLDYMFASESIVVEAIVFN